MNPERDEAAGKAAYVAYFGDDEDWEAYPEERAEWIGIGKAAASAWIGDEPVYEHDGEARTWDGFDISPSEALQNCIEWGMVQIGGGEV